MKSSTVAGYLTLVVLLTGLLLLPSRGVAQESGSNQQQSSSNHFEDKDITKAANAGLARQQQQLAAGREKLLKQYESVPTPRLSDGHPDLNGRWTNPRVFCDKSGKCALDVVDGGYTVFYDSKGILHSDYPERSVDEKSNADNEANGSSPFIFETLDGDARREANPNKPSYKPELEAKVANLNLNANQVDPHIFCHPDGPREAAPARIIEAAGTVVFLYANGENGNYWRIIPSDGRAHRTDLDESYFGDSVGHWEGDVFVVDTIGFNDDTWLGGDGWFHSTALHEVERITRQGNVLHYQATFEDPQVLTKPWVKAPSTLVLSTDPEGEIYEVARCQNDDLHHIVNHDHF